MKYSVNKHASIWNKLLHKKANGYCQIFKEYSITVNTSILRINKIIVWAKAKNQFVPKKYKQCLENPNKNWPVFSQGKAWPGKWFGCSIRPVFLDPCLCSALSGHHRCDPHQHPVIGKRYDLLIYLCKVLQSYWLKEVI